MNTVFDKAWIVAVDMGYGHQRTADNLRCFSPEAEVINANNYPGMPDKDRRIWEGSRKFYELISTLKSVPLAGNFAFSVFDLFQKVPPFYPKRNLSDPSFALREIFWSLKIGWGRDLIERLKTKPLPLVSTFFTPAFMAEFFDYPGEIFCVICDTDISRTWASLEPQKSKIKYFAPTERVVGRLKAYGVKAENIFLTGYPLPLENIGGEKMEVLRNDLRHRLLNLDPQKKYLAKYGCLVKECLGDLPREKDHPLTLTFSVGGAGAQKEIGLRIVKNLKGQIRKGEIRVILAAGIRKNINDYFLRGIERLGLAGEVGRSLEVLFTPAVREYFQKFNQVLRKTDIFWTKPSELSFYAALGLPLIIAPTIGSHEEFNQRWLLKSGFGILEKDPDCVADWLFDLLENGYLAKRSLEGFIEGEKLGVFKIQKIISQCPGF